MDDLVANFRIKKEKNEEEKLIDENEKKIELLNA